MSAYGAVLSLLLTLETILDSWWSVLLNRGQLQSLREMVSSLQQFLENHPLTEGDQTAASRLEIRIKDAAFKAENFIESLCQLKYLICSFLFIILKYVILVKALLVALFVFQNPMHLAFKAIVVILIIRVWSTFRQVLHEVKHGFLKMISVAVQYVQHTFVPEPQGLEQVMKEVESIMNEVIEIKSHYGGKTGRNPRPVASSSRVNSGVRRKNVVVGFDSDLLEIKKLLIYGSSKLEAVSIVGMGGIGKTTLAKQVYDDSCIRYRFDIQTWVTMSQDYSLLQVLRAILDSAGMLKENMSETSEQKLGEALNRSLMRRMYLIVLDDIWDTENWDSVKRYFPENNNGSRVLLTTRLLKVAVYANSCSPFYQMCFLDQDQSWQLLCNKVFGERKCPVELEELGHLIAKNCGGLPLAIVVIGGLLSKAGGTHEYWRNTARNLDSSATNNNEDEHCMKILCMSYDHLPHCLRPCFLYMCEFPKNREIPVWKLLRLWASEGFIRSNGSKSLKDLAEDYLEDLISRNLVLVSARKANGKVKTCIIHVLLWNFCLHKSHEENFLYVVGRKEDALKEGSKPLCSRLFFQFLADGSTSSSHSNVVERTFEQNFRYGIEMCSPNFSSFLYTGPLYSSRLHRFLAYRLLRVLDLFLSSFARFPDEILNLYNLRYLALTGINACVPRSISKLSNLHTLVVYSYLSPYILLLPEGILKMAKLRHICVLPSIFPNPPFYHSFLANSSLVLENLQTLFDIRNFRCSLKMIRRIPNLKKLGISYTDSPSRVWSRYQLESLVNLHQLETLKLVIKKSSNVSSWPSVAFPQKLTSLNLSGCAIPWKSMVIIGRLPNLEVLKLRNLACKGSKWKAVKNKFPRLKHLLLEKLDLVRWRAHKHHFHSLERLIIRSCDKLEGIPSGIGEIQTLEMIELVDCPSAVVNSAREIQEEQESMGKDLKVHVQSSRPLKYKLRSTE